MARRPQKNQKKKEMLSVDCGPRTLSCHGFTLIEVLVAIVILATGLVLVAEGLGRTQQAFRISQNLLTASGIAEERFAEAEIQLREFRKLSLAHSEGEEKFPGRKFNWSKDINPYHGEGIEDETKLNQVDIAVSWDEGPARRNREKLSSLLLNRDKPQEP